MSRGALMLESSQCGGCGTLGNGGATLPRWMSSQFGVRCNIGIRGAKLSFGALPVGCVWIPCRPAVGWRTEDSRTHFQSLHVTQSTHVFFPSPPNTCHTPHLSHRGLKENRAELPPDRFAGDQNELLPPRNPLMERIEFLAIKMNFCRQGSKCWRSP